MKKYFFFTTLIMISLLNISCDDSINPNATFRERYSLNGIMRSDTSYQIITLSHSYQPNENDPLTYTEDPSIQGAEVNIYYDNKLYHMRDTSIARFDTSRYKSPIKYYYNSDLKPGPNKVIEIDAYLPNGLLLQSVSNTPDIPKFGFFDYSSDKLIPPSFGSRISIFWKNIPNILYSAKLNLNYYIKGDSALHKIEVPMMYYLENGNSTPFYPSPTTNPYLYIEVETINKFLNEFPTEGFSKKDYSIISITLELIVFDEYLSKYYSSVRQGIDGFTVKLDNPDYSNIKGGFGVFGSYIKTSYELKFVPSYLSSLGY
jgi:hypothetical protein